MMDAAQGANRLVSPIGFPKVNLPMIVIRQEYLYICQGDHCAAAILSAFETWTIGKLKRGEADPWIYKSQKEMHDDLTSLFGFSQIKLAFKKLRQWKFLVGRPHSDHSVDQTLEYHFETETVQATMDDYAQPSNSSARGSKSTNGEGQNQPVQASISIYPDSQNQPLIVSKPTHANGQKQPLSLYRESYTENLSESSSRESHAGAREDKSAAAAAFDPEANQDDFADEEQDAPEEDAVLAKWARVVKPLDNERNQANLRAACEEFGPVVVLELINVFLEKGGRSWALMAALLGDRRKPKKTDGQDWQRYVDDDFRQAVLEDGEESAVSVDSEPEMA